MVGKNIFYPSLCNKKDFINFLVLIQFCLSTEIRFDHFTLFMASYKSTGANPVFLPAEETDEHKKTIYVDLENPNIINNIDSTFDYIINDWMGTSSIFPLPLLYFLI